MTQPMLLDIGCGMGTSEGYRDAGFEVYGLDTHDRPAWRRRFGGSHFFVDGMGDAFWDSDIVGFDAYHCRSQEYDGYGLMRNRLTQLGRPWVLEGVTASPIRHDVMLCGSMFGLDVFCHRFYESNIALGKQKHRRHMGRDPDISTRIRETPAAYTRFIGETIYHYLTDILPGKERSRLDFYRDVTFLHPLCYLSTRQVDV